MIPRPCICGALLALALAWPTASPAAADRGGIADATARIATAETALDTAQASPDRIGDFGRAVADYEAALATLRAEVTATGERAETLAAGFASRRVEIARLLAALEAMSRGSADPLPSLHPQGPLAAARASAMLNRLTPALQAEATELAGQVQALAAARESYGVGRDRLAAGLARLDAAQATLTEAMAAAAPGMLEPGQPTVTMMARDSASLTALAGALASAPDAPPAPEPTGDPFRWPIAGTLNYRFNEPDAAGVRRPGLVVGAPTQALVSAPSDALVRYAGPFLEYGFVVVLEPDTDTMVILAGLDRLLVRTGASVSRGTILGLLGGRHMDAEEYVMLPGADTGSGPHETLYIEVRQGQGPVDPEPLFVGENG
jgi:septal ring factor EnvC (AmiA/AmiB activator)